MSTVRPSIRLGSNGNKQGAGAYGVKLSIVDRDVVHKSPVGLLTRAEPSVMF